MIKIEKDQYKFESSGRAFSTYGCDGISLSKEGKVRHGYDGYLELKDEQGKENYELELTDEEKKELAQFMVNEWSAWGGLV